jgi:acetate kinase
MNILVANLGSTSFKYRLFRFEGTGETLLAKGGYERVTDYGEAIDSCLESLRSAGHLKTADDLQGVGFKTVLGDGITGCVDADERVEEALLRCADLAPAHNPPYARGIRRFRERLPRVPRVALFETAFYQWVPEYANRYAVPKAWREAGLRRYGFHGASHKFIAERSAELSGPAGRRGADARSLHQGPRPVHRQAAARGLVPPRRQQLRDGHPQRRGHRHQHGLLSAERTAAEQPGG